LVLACPVAGRDACRTYVLSYPRLSWAWRINGRTYLFFDFAVGFFLLTAVFLAATFLAAGFFTMVF